MHKASVLQHNWEKLGYTNVVAVGKNKRDKNVLYSVFFSCYDCLFVHTHVRVKVTLCKCNERNKKITHLDYSMCEFTCLLRITFYLCRITQIKGDSLTFSSVLT